MTTGHTTSILQIPMPIPGTQNAPKFNGKFVTDFLSVLVQHGANAGITDLDSLVPYILQYSSDEVKELIRYEPEFDPDYTTTQTFKAAKEQLLLLYGDADEPPNYTEDMLRDFCRDQSAKSPFKNRKDIEVYHQEFSKIAGPLIKKAKITKQMRDFYFVAGISSSIKEWFMQQVPEAKRRRTSPPSIAESVAILKSRFDTDTLTFEPWSEQADTRERRVTFDVEGMRTDATTTLRSTPRPPTPPMGTMSVEDITRMMEQMNISIARLESLQQSSNTAATGNAADKSFPRRCFMCGKTGAHPLSLSRCPETHSLLDMGFIRFDTNRGRYVMKDGEDLPRIPGGFIGGVADYIRTQARDQANTTARTNSIGLSYGEEPVLKGDVFAVSSLGYSDYRADPVTRSGKESNRFDPAQKPQNKGKNRVPERDLPPHIPPTQSTPPASVPPRALTNIPPPSHPVNRSDGWKDSRGSGSKPRKDVVMQDVNAKPEKSTPSYHLTTDVQDLVDPKAVYKKIMDVNISVPLVELIGSSPGLQKLLSESTRVRRDYKTKSAEYSAYDYDDYWHGDDDELPCAVVRGACVGEPSRVPEFLTRYSSAIQRMPEDRYFAMTTGTMTIMIGGIEFTAMIDSGSELNLASRSVPTRASIPVDFEGMKWSLKGIHGLPEQLQGCATDVPMRLGRHEFAHHLFISHQELTPHDIILGQPFLQWFAARMDYEREGGTKLYLWKDGDKKGRPTIVISVTDPADPRNTTTITSRKHSHQAAHVEEITDEEDF